MNERRERGGGTMGGAENQSISDSNPVTTQIKNDAAHQLAAGVSSLAKLRGKSERTSDKPP